MITESTALCVARLTHLVHTKMNTLLCKELFDSWRDETGRSDPPSGLLTAIREIVKSMGSLGKSTALSAISVFSSVQWLIPLF